MSRTFKLSYFDARARGEPARMLFALAGQKYEDKIYDFESEWPKIKGDKTKFPLGQLPVLDIYEDGKHTQIFQSRAIARYIAREFPGDYYGKNNLESTRIDEILGIVADIEIAITEAYDTNDAAKREALLIKTRNGSMKPSFDFIEKLFNDGRKFALGENFTLADIVIFNTIDSFMDSMISVKGYFDPYPNQLKFYQRVKTDSPLTQYLKTRKSTKY